VLVVQAPTLLSIWSQLCERADAEASTKPSRLGTVQELGPAYLELSGPSACVLRRAESPNDRTRIAIRLSQILAGYCDPSALAHHDPSMLSRISRDGRSYDGGYGPVLDVEMPRLIRHLGRYPESRRAVLWLAQRPDALESVDVPTVFGMQFTRRDGALLDATVYSRSLDFVSSLSVDFGVFAGILSLLVRELDLNIGRVGLVAGSCHRYLRDIHSQLRPNAPTVDVMPAVDVGGTYLRSELIELRARDNELRRACAAGRFQQQPLDTWLPRSSFVAWLSDALVESHAAHVAASI
jgi:hypothetical protein